MKRFLSFLLAMVMLFSIITMVSIESAAIGTYGVNLDSACYSSSNPFRNYWGQCTWYAWGRALEKTGVALPHRGNAKTWTSGAVSTPRANSVVVWTGGTYGHVAFVEAYDGTNIYITEANRVPGQYSEGVINLSTRRFTYTCGGSGGYTVDLPYGYIYCGQVVPSSSEESEQDKYIGSRNTSGDFNGDGRSDYAVLYDYGRNRAQVHVFLSTGNDFSEEVWWRSDTVNSFDASRVSGRFSAGDFNGDGKDDIAMMYQYSDLQSTIFVLLSNGSSFKNENWKSLSEYKSMLVIDRFVAGDYNGDGKCDIATMYEYDYTISRLHVFLSNGSSFLDPAHWAVLNEYCASKVCGRMVSGDFNGDKKDDIATMYDYGNETMRIHVFPSKTSSFGNAEVWYLSNSYLADRTTGRYTSGDFNGDGIDDLAAMYNYGNQVCSDHVWLSQKTKFSDVQFWANHSSYFADHVSGRYYGGDYNGDNKDDIAAFYYYPDKSGLQVSLSTGSGFSSSSWNQISGYDCSRTTGIKSLYDDNYSPNFTLKKKTIPHTHSWNSGVITKTATCTATGTKKFTCTVCSQTKTETIAKSAHQYKKEVISPTASSLGYTVEKCSLCKNEKSRTAFTAPTGKLTLKHSARTANAIKVQWNSVKTATGYQVQISTKDGKKWSTYSNLKAGVTNYTFKNLSAGNNYKFRVRFYIKAADGKNYFSPWSTTLNSPTLPTGTTVTKLTPAKKAFTAQWKKNAAVTGYQVQYSLKSNFSGAKTITVKSLKTLKAVAKKLYAGKYYYVRIRTYKTIAKANYFSTWSKTYKVKTK